MIPAVSLLSLLACEAGGRETDDSASGGAPDICELPEAVDFGEVPVGTYAVIFFSLSNCGDGELTIASITQSGSGAFAFGLGDDTGSHGLSISAHTAFVLAVSYTPDDTLGDTGTLTITSDDPDQPTTLLPMSGAGE